MMAAVNVWRSAAALRAAGLAVAFVLCALMSTGCSASRTFTVGEPGASSAPLPDIGPAPIDRNDPWEGMNRRVYRFNAGFDRYVFLPALDVWRFILPSPVRRGFSNVLSHVGQITSLVNSIVQLSPEKTVGTVGRIIINSTFGIAGLFDAATGIGLVDHGEDFGQTLGVYGVPPGPYLVLPFMGPSSTRDTGGFVVDRAFITWLQWQAFGGSQSYTFLPVAMQTRDDLAFRYGELGPFEYELMRFLYLEWRATQVAL